MPVPRRRDRAVRATRVWQALVSPHATSYLAPVALWLYMLMVQLGLLNLLIAIMTDTYFKVRRTSPAAHAPFTPAPEHDP